MKYRRVRCYLFDDNNIYCHYVSLSKKGTRENFKNLLIVLNSTYGAHHHIKSFYDYKKNLKYISLSHSWLKKEE